MTYIWNSTGRYQELFRDCHKKKKKSLLRVNERPIPTSSGPDIPGRLHPDTSLKLPTQRNIFPYWKDWGIQTLKMEKKEENVGNNRKKNKKIKISVFRCPLGKKKKCSFQNSDLFQKVFRKKGHLFPQMLCLTSVVWESTSPVGLPVYLSLPPPDPRRFSSGFLWCILSFRAWFGFCRICVSWTMQRQRGWEEQKVQEGTTWRGGDGQPHTSHIILALKKGLKRTWWKHEFPPTD